MKPLTAETPELLETQVSPWLLWTWKTLGLLMPLLILMMPFFLLSSTLGFLHEKFGHGLIAALAPVLVAGIWVLLLLQVPQLGNGALSTPHELGMSFGTNQVVVGESGLSLLSFHRPLHKVKQLWSWSKTTNQQLMFKRSHKAVCRMESEVWILRLALFPHGLQPGRYKVNSWVHLRLWQLDVALTFLHRFGMIYRGPREQNANTSHHSVVFVVSKYFPPEFPAMLGLLRDEDRLFLYVFVSYGWCMPTSTFRAGGAAVV